MFKKNFKIITFVILLICILSSTVVATSENIPTIKESVFKAEDNITISDNVLGNCFLAGTNITINGIISGDVFVAGTNVEINGTITGNLFVSSQNVTINGQLYKDAFVACKTLNVSEDAVISRDLFCAGETLNYNGTTGRNLNIAISNLNINENAVIDGNLNYWSNKETTIPEYVVANEINYHQSAKLSVVDYILDLLSVIILTTIIWGICLLMFPKFIENSKTILSKKSLKTLGIGTLAFISTPIICLILFILSLLLSLPTLAFGLFTLIGFVYAIAIIISIAIISIALAGFLKEKFKLKDLHKNIWYILAITIIIWLLKLIPIINGITMFVVIVTAFGIITLNIFNRRKE